MKYSEFNVRDENIEILKSQKIKEKLKKRKMTQLGLTYI